LCLHHLPDFAITHIGFSTSYARTFLAVPNVGFNMLQKVLVGPVGDRFLRDVRRAGRQLLVWTVNEDEMMRWSIAQGIDGVITDDPVRFRRVCDDWNAAVGPTGGVDGEDEKVVVRISWRRWLYAIWWWLVVFLYGILFRYRFPETVDQFLRKRRRERETGRESEPRGKGDAG
jgi:phosphatidylglycerol phospholipase C